MHISGNKRREVRLHDATGSPTVDTNVARDEFERAGIKSLKAGQSFVHKVEVRDGKNYLRAMTPVPVVLKKCVMCHPHYANVKKGEPIGAVSYTLAIERSTSLVLRIVVFVAASGSRGVPVLRFEVDRLIDSLPDLCPAFPFPKRTGPVAAIRRQNLTDRRIAGVAGTDCAASRPSRVFWQGWIPEAEARTWRTAAFPKKKDTEVAIH
jgi:hypothetical protein